LKLFFKGRRWVLLAHQYLRRLKPTSAPARFTNGTDRQLRGKKVAFSFPPVQAVLFCMEEFSIH